jgi:HK97 family phage portal protein
MMMPIFSEALKRLLPDRVRASAPSQKASRVGPLIAYESPGQPVWSPRDYGAFAREGFMQNAIVYRSVRMVAEAAASIPLLLYEGGVEVESHPFLDLMRRPSLDHTGTDFLEAWYGFLLVAGNAYVEAVSVDGEIRELHNLRPDRMKVLPGLDGWPEGFEYTVGGKSVRFIEDAVPGVRPILHTRLFHPANDHYGMSPIEAAAVAIDIHNTASGWNKALLDNSARPSGALVYSASNGQMTEDQFTRLKRELETSFQGAAHAGRPLLLEGGLDWKPLSMTPKDMDFIEAKNSAAREIALAIGVPPMLLGIPGDATYSNYAEAQRAFWRNTVLPVVNRMAQAFSMWLSPAFSLALGDSPSSSRPPSAGPLLELRPDLDQVEALAPERESLWTRLEAASFLTEDEKRAAAGYAAKDQGPAALAGKYSQDQPRIPAGNPGVGGRWVGDGGAGQGGGGGTGGSATNGGPLEGLYRTLIHHDYRAGPNVICAPELQCSQEEVAFYLARAGYPGQDPAQPTNDQDTNFVIDPRNDIPGGFVVTQVSPDGLTIVNTTRLGHVFHSGQIVRTASRNHDGSWSVTTRGTGYNIWSPLLNAANQWQGPKLFNYIDDQMRQRIKIYHGAK